MSDNQGLLQTVFDVLAAEGHFADGAVGAPDTPLADGGIELTSLDLVRVLVLLEEKLSIELDDAAIMNANFATVGDLVEVVEQSVRTAAGSAEGKPR